jgi:hypothetical protein
MPIASTMPNSDRLFSEKPEQLHERERADQRDGDRQQRHDRRPPALEEHEHDEHDQRDRFEQRLDHVADAGADKQRRVVGDRVLDALREALLQLLHLDVDRVGRVDRVGAGELEDRDADGGLVVVDRGRVVVGGVEQDVADVATRVTRPPSPRLMTMLPNSSGVASCPCALTVYWKSAAPGRQRLRADDARGDLHVLLAHGRPTTSPAVIPRAVSFCGSSHRRIA